MNWRIIKEEKLLSNDLNSFLKDLKNLVVIGMGNELRGDDSVGIVVVRMLKPHINKKLRVFEGHTTPEVFISPTCSLQPSHVLIVDAAELKGKPGEWRLLFSNELNESLLTTHSIPPTEIASNIEQRCNAKVAFIGIQPLKRDINLSLSKDCEKGAIELVNSILFIMNPTKS
jgi:hydrogenase 3 maturation protease